MNKSLYFAWVVSLVAMLGSLYFSEIAHFIPCELCWFQRICMYPLTIILGIACFRNDHKIAYYVLPVAIVGGMFSIVHILEENIHALAGICKQGVSCSTDYIHWFGFVTIPMLALCAFILISISMVVTLRNR